MWPFKRRNRKLPGVEQHSNGEISFTLTDEEEVEVNDFFRMLKGSTQEGEQGAINTTISVSFIVFLSGPDGSPPRRCQRPTYIEERPERY
jgi:hypothetical protein